MPLPFRPLKLVLEKIVCIYHDFSLELKYSLYFFHESAFALSRFVFFTSFYFFELLHRSVLHDTLFSMAFKMG
jgi:hypothetical protein